MRTLVGFFSAVACSGPQPRTYDVVIGKLTHHANGLLREDWLRLISETSPSKLPVSALEPAGATEPPDTNTNDANDEY